MNQTEQYALNQWAKDDRILMEDFNVDNLKVEQALAAQASRLASRGNCEVYTLFYNGSGTNTNTLYFASNLSPSLILITGGEGALMALVPGAKATTGYSGLGMSIITHTWYNNRVTWTGTGSTYEAMCNASGKEYYAVIFAH